MNAASLWRDLGRRAAYLAGRYEAFLVDDDAGRAACVRLLEEVRHEELRRVHGPSPLDSAVFGEGPVPDELLACRDRRTGQVIGCARGVMVPAVRDVPACVAEYQLDKIPAEMSDHTVILTRFTVAKAYRDTAASLAIIERIYRFGLERDYVALISCEPGLLNLYLGIGARVIGRVHPSPAGGLRIPMAIVPHDIEHVRAIRSHMLRVVKRFDGPLSDRGVRWYRDLIARGGPIESGVAPFSDAGSDLHRCLTAGMSPAGIEAVLKNALLISCHAGDVLIREDDGGKAMGFVAAGSLGVVHAGRTLASLGPGELFGEMALVLDGPRTATVTAESDATRVVLLSQNATRRVSAPDDVGALWRNLARIAAERLVRSRADSA